MNILGWSRWIPRRTVLINWQPNLKDNHAKKKKQNDFKSNISIQVDFLKILNEKTAL